MRVAEALGPGSPVVHLDQSLESVDEAIVLLGSIHAIVVRMLKDIAPTGMDLAALALLE